MNTLENDNQFSRLYEPMLPTNEAAKMLGVSNHFMFKDRRRPQPLIPFVKIGSAVRYRLSDLQAFIEASTRRSA